MQKFIRLFLIFTLLLTTLAIPALANNQNKINLALSSAQKWLNLVDNGAYAESWIQAASYFKNAITQDQWEKSLIAVRKPLGKIISREPMSKKYVTSIAGAPDGEYVIIQFKTSFERKKSAIETLTTMIDSDGKWHTAGYYIK